MGKNGWFQNIYILYRLISILIKVPELMKQKFPLVLLILSLTLFSCKSPKAENLEEMARLAARPEAVLVKTVKLEKSTFYHELISNGKVSSSEKAVVPFKINGIIRELKIQNGQKVKAGDLMAVIDDFDYKTQLIRAKQGLEKAEINFKDDLLSNFTTSILQIFLRQKLRSHVSAADLKML